MCWIQETSSLQFDVSYNINKKSLNIVLGGDAVMAYRITWQCAKEKVFHMLLEQESQNETLNKQAKPNTIGTTKVMGLSLWIQIQKPCVTTCEV